MHDCQRALPPLATATGTSPPLRTLHTVSNIVVVGAGVAGLSCAQALRASGRSPLLIERSRGVGGRCATRRLDSQIVDHGVTFLHGSDPEFVSALEAVSAANDAFESLTWPERCAGNGPACLPRAFSGFEHRIAWTQGVNAFPQSLAADLDIRRETPVVGLGLGEHGWRVRLEGGDELATRDLVIALAAPQLAILLDTLDPSPSPARRELDALRALLRTTATEPCLTVSALYPPGSLTPPWDLDYPRDSKIIQLISHDSTKRGPGARPAFVFQCHAAWSRRCLERGDDWTEPVLTEAARLLGPAAAEPFAVHAHRWRYARVARDSAFRGPVLIELPGGIRLGVAGELFAEGGGVQAAYLSGRRLAERLISESRPALVVATSQSSADPNPAADLDAGASEPA